MVNLPRVVVAAPASGQGKTTVATGLMAALGARGLVVSSGGVTVVGKGQFVPQ